VESWIYSAKHLCDETGFFPLLSGVVIQARKLEVGETCRGCIEIFTCTSFTRATRSHVAKELRQPRTATMTT
jgi:hypothetical protein